MLRQVYSIVSFLLPVALCTSLSYEINAQPTSTLTVVVKGIKHQKGQICIRVFASEKGFPLGKTGEVKSGCTPITGNYVKKQFTGLKPGTYAVAVLDDQNGDHQLHRDFLGFPQEGFGISNNPTVSVLTGVPKFRDASFALQKNTTINIFMKYGLDP